MPDSLSIRPVRASVSVSISAPVTNWYAQTITSGTVRQRTALKSDQPQHHGIEVPIHQIRVPLGRIATCAPSLA